MTRHEKRGDTVPSVELADIWTKYREALIAFLRSKISNPADVEEIFQEILFKTHKGLERLNEGGSLKSWLFQIANNTIIDFYRKKRNDNVLHTADLWYLDTNTSEKHVLEDCVRPFIDALPAEPGNLLRKVELEGVSQKVYAEELGISYSTLKSRVQSARRLLLRLFEDCCDFSLDTQGNVIGYSRKHSSCNDCGVDESNQS